MRSAFIQAVMEWATRDSQLWLLTGDLGYSVLEPFRERFPQRYANVGVAEQNLIGIAAGLALTGKTVVAYSIVNFPVMRALEQIRNDVAYHNLPVVIAVVGGGLVYGAHGYTHHGAEDIGVMRLMPNMKIIVPADAVEARWALQHVRNQPGPTYFRMARGGEQPIPGALLDEHPLSVPRLLRTGGDITIAASGPIVQLALQAAERLQAERVHAEVFSVPCLQPLDCQPLFASAGRTGRLMTIEDHGAGGLGTMLAERLSQSTETFAFRVMTYRREPITLAGRQDFLRGQHGLDEAGICTAIRDWVSR